MVGILPRAARRVWPAVPNFRDMTPERRKELAKKGRAALGDKVHRFTKAEAKAAGKKSARVRAIAAQKKGTA